MDKTFAPGTFTPRPKRASIGQMAWAQGVIESKLMLRHGEQLLLSIIIPLALLFGADRMQDISGLTLDEVFPLILAIAATSAGFTGQAISVAFDRRYGALKRTGASGVPAWTIIAGKVMAVCSMVIVQVVILGTAAAIMGLRIPLSGLALGALLLILGVASFTALGLLLGGTLNSEAVLALANLLWFLLLGAAGWALYSQGLGDNGLVTLIPTVALAGGFADAFSGHFPGLEIAVLAGWAVVASYLATKWFRFDG